MRLIRSVCRPANIGLSLRFQRCQNAKISTVLSDTSNFVYGSNIPGRDRLYVSASAATSALEDGRPRKRLSKNERKTMVETYVNKYRITNEGKFPTVSHTIKEIGGSYYVVRQIIQEMLYNSKQSSTDSKYISMEKSATKKKKMTYNSKKPVDFKDIYLEKSATKNHEMICNSEEQSTCTRDTSLEKSAVKEDDISTKFEEVPQTRELGEGTKPTSEDIENSSSTIFQSKQDQQLFVSVETDEARDVGAQIHHLIDKPESSRNLDYEKEREILEKKVISDASKHKAGPVESTEISEREQPHKKYAGSLSVWNNLKSFANGILSMWKRS